MTDDRPDYLWDRRGAIDPEVARLEAVLSVLRHRGTMPALPARAASVPARLGLRVVVFGLSAAATLLLVSGAGWFGLAHRQLGWAVERLAGDPVIDGQTLVASGQLRRGRWLETGSAGKARVRVGEIGLVDVDPETRLQLISPRGREHRLSLERGTIHAQIWAPPRAFVVDTPSAVATDLGCAYTLKVDETGAGLVRVTAGWVGFESGGRESFIPKDAVCPTRPTIGPGTPYYEDAPAGYPAALTLLDFGPPTDPGRAAALDTVLSTARRKDALTLWHLLTRGTIEERRLVYARMSELVPPPEGVTLDGVLRRDRRATDRWWNALGLDDASWWRIWMREWEGK
ncbi:MAG: FecR domain-containing protein [Vicinamibacterales bacterium]